MCLLLFSRDSEQVVNDLMIRFGESSLKPVCVDDLPPKITDEHVPQNALSNSLHITVFSRGFLCFLERKPGDAFAVFKQLDPKKTIAVFCQGLRAEEVTSCHTAPLRSFNLWGKFFVRLDKNTACFPEELLKKIENVVPKQTANRLDIVLVPKLVNQENSSVYVILPKILSDWGTVEAQIELEDRSKTVKMNKINPYVLQFSLPDEFLTVSHSAVDVIIRHRNISVCSEKLQVVSDCCTAELRPRTSRDSRKLKSQSVPEERIVDKRRGSTLGENLQVLRDIVVPEEDEDELDQAEMVAKRQSEEIKNRLKVLCWKLALEEMNTILKSDEIPESNEFQSSPGDPDLEIQIREASSDESTDETGEQSSCSSPYPLPQDCEPDVYTISPNRPTWLDIQPAYASSEDNAMQYMCMNQLHKKEELKPHEHILRDPNFLVEEEEASSLAPDVYDLYTPMETPFTPLGAQGHTLSRYLDDDDASYSEYKHSYPSVNNHTYCNLESMKKLSRSQQTLLELMHAFREGTITLSMTERHIRLWRQKHADEAYWPQVNRGHSAIEHWKEISSRRSRNIPDESRIESQNPLSRDQCPIYPGAQPPPLPDRPPLLTRPPLNDFQPTTVSRRTLQRSNAINRCTGFWDTPDDDSVSTRCLRRTNKDPNFRINMLLELCEKYDMDGLAEQFLTEVFCDAEKENNQDLKVQNTRFSNQDYRREVISRMEADSIKNNDDSEVDANTYYRSISAPNGQHVKTVKTLAENGERPPQNSKRRVRKVAAKKEENASDTVCLSNSQKELKEILDAFKRGDRTMSQTEQLCDAWKDRNPEMSTTREVQLRLIQDEYKNRQEKAKQAGFKYFPIIKNKKKNSKQMDIEADKVKTIQKSEKSDRIVKSQRKISGISESNEVLKNVGSNVKECLKRRKKSRPYQEKISPTLSPELPRQRFSSRHSPARRGGRKTIPSDSSVSKPDPPPKPKHLLRATRRISDENIPPEHSDEDNEDYITPNKPSRTRRKISRARTRNLSVASSKDTSPAPHMTELNIGHGERKISKQRDQSKKEVEKVDKKEVSMFYISSKKWSSDSDVRSGELQNVPVYLELLNSKRNAPIKEFDKESEDGDEST